MGDVVFRLEYSNKDKDEECFKIAVSSYLTRDTVIFFAIIYYK